MMARVKEKALLVICFDESKSTVTLQGNSRLTSRRNPPVGKATRHWCNLFKVSVRVKSPDHLEKLQLFPLYKTNPDTLIYK
jgi:hypothetical protein